MISKVLLGGVLGGLAMFIWLGLSWAVLPFHMGQFTALTDDNPIAVMVTSTPPMETGLYMFPGMPEGETSEEAKQHLHDQAVSGPTVTFMSYQRDGFDPMSPMPYVTGLLSCILASCLLVWVIVQFGRPSLTFAEKVGISAVVGLVVGVTGHVVTGAFFLFPTGHVALEVVDQLVGWTLAGLVIAWATKPRLTATTTSGA